MKLFCKSRGLGIGGTLEINSICFEFDCTFLITYSEEYV